MQLDAVVVIARAPHDNLGHARLGGYHEARDGLGRLDGVAARNVHQQRIKVRAHALGRLAAQRLERGRARGRLGLRDHRLQNGGIVGTQRRLPILQEESRARRRGRARRGRALALERKRLLVRGGALRGRVLVVHRCEALLRLRHAQLVQCRAHAFGPLGIALALLHAQRGRFQHLVCVRARNAHRSHAPLEALCKLVVVGHRRGLAGGHARSGRRRRGRCWRRLRLHARAPRNLAARIRLKDGGGGRVHVTNRRGLHEPAQPRIGEHVAEQHPRRPNARALGAVDHGVAHGAKRVHLLRHALPQHAHFQLPSGKLAHRV